MILKNVGLLAIPTGKTAQKGAAQGQIELIENAAVCIEDGVIVYAGPDEKLPGGKLPDGDVIDDDSVNIRLSHNPAVKGGDFY